MKISALLIDLDGTVYFKDKLFNGVLEAFQEIKRRKIPFRFITNTTTQTRKMTVDKLAKMGFETTVESIFSSPQASRLYCLKMNYQKIWLLTSSSVLAEEFEGLELVEKNPDAIVLGDLGKDFTRDKLNPVFLEMLNGKKLIAMHKNRFWKTESSLTMDLGCFVTALEYATKQEAIIIGKPSKDFFELAIQGWNFSGKEIVAIGDDIEADVGGAKNSGLSGILVRTGKFNEKFLSQVKPDKIINNFGELPQLFN
ncbi:TIGR01458 family HAD-type hydrolase [bacterium]|nr:TIGR01458 family HAD-type hydrolase [bacterium]